jgi:diguanylate cyclase
VPANTHIFLLGLAVGTTLLGLGLLLGYWLGRRSLPPDMIDRQKFLSFLQNLSSWTSEYSVDVSRYQSQLTAIDERFRSSEVPPAQREELLSTLSQIMHANRQLQARLENAEQKLELQTDQISSYLTEARTDGLTGLFNRRAFDKAIDGLFADWEQKGQAFSLGLIDIDHFKQINDTYGHPAGDAVLRHISQTLQAEMSGVVCVARYGGEEFAVLSKSSAVDTAAALDKLREAVSQVKVTHENHVISVTLSAGAAQIEAEDKVGKVVRRADEALYAAKLGGRNRVYLHDGRICRLITQATSFAANALSGPGGARGAAPDLGASITNAADASMHERVSERLQRIVAEESQRLVQR